MQTTYKHILYKLSARKLKFVFIIKMVWKRKILSTQKYSFISKVSSNITYMLECNVNCPHIMVSISRDDVVSQWLQKQNFDMTQLPIDKSTYYLLTCQKYILSCRLSTQSHLKILWMLGTYDRYFKTVSDSRTALSNDQGFFQTEVIGVDSD